MTTRCTAATIVLVDDDEWILNTTRLWLLNAGFTSIVVLNDNRELLPMLNDNLVGVVVLDLMMPHCSGQELLPEITRLHPEVQVIVMTGSQEIDSAVTCMKHGAIDYLLKPADPDRLVTCVQNAMQIYNLRSELHAIRRHLNTETPANPSAFSPILTRSRMMQQLFKYLEAVSLSPEPLLITGETGVGKELFARACHDAGCRTGAFIAENVAGLDELVFTDTLFGHRRGAFTGADQDRKGLVAQAAGGTLFLDEIGDIGPAAQIKLLRFLQEKQYLPLGMDHPVRTDVRIVAATLRDPNELVAKGLLRRDLYYRLSFHQLHIPPLRERKEDIPLLTVNFLEEAAAALNRPTPTPPQALFDHLAVYPFPGNVRELKAMVFDAVSRHQGHVMSLDCFRALQPGRHGTPSSPARLDDQGPSIQFSQTSFPTLKEAEELLIREALLRAGGKKSVAAALLGITRQALYSRLSNNKPSPS
ncbi:MAG: sigma-54-dependent Fis family transcriptional regulator [Magnetococcales bacterium]|nr:sigma-54-dependent Fis family transcriptional regulator [Magnetococcales bacterium]